MNSDAKRSTAIFVFSTPFRPNLKQMTVEFWIKTVNGRTITFGTQLKTIDKRFKINHKQIIINDTHFKRKNKTIKAMLIIVSSFFSTCRSFKALFWIPRDNRKYKSNAIEIKFYVTFLPTQTVVGYQVRRATAASYGRELKRISPEGRPVTISTLAIAR